MDKKQNLDQQFQTWEEEKASLLSRLLEAEKAQEKVTKLEAKLAANQKILDVKENVIFLNTQEIKEQEKVVQEQEETIKVLEEQIGILKDYLRDAKQKRFGRSSEKVDLPYPQFSFMKDAIFNEEPKDGNQDDSKEEKEKKAKREKKAFT